MRNKSKFIEINIKSIPLKSALTTKIGEIPELPQEFHSYTHNYVKKMTYRKI